ncbi:EamA family transporter [Colwellia sp. 4_MG-2023]|jgi:drug/metabolite transporter (DMT)-like permease|uniref:EamA family transporter n=1 Tax=unclassified Colwellia TaxID=196834 RepID=UPI0026E3FD5F|nr:MULTISPECIES: EamA family transporter [unclassified Colwellia]MDO6487640.1 EamA family transporter [Colwellia sp. 6_MG-2023]MDO6507369.1 EamA family transporter [Colwellia sp. 5_MG-2023]MDO6556102.1 EamA family transporter [Colwellia sp. 4_MG-2023]
MIYLVITTLIWAFSFGLIGNTLKGIDPLQIADTRLLLALLAFLPFIKLRNTNWQEKKQLILLGAFQYGVMYTCYLSAFRYLPSHLVALFSVLTPLYIVIINDLRQRSFTPWYLLATILSVFGAAIIKMGNIDSNEIWLGFGLMQIANIAFAFGQVYYRDWKQKRPHISDSSVFGFLYLGATVFTILATLLISQKPPLPLDATPEQWLVLVYMGVIASGLSFFFWNKGGTQTSVGVLATFNNAVVPLAMFASLFVFGEAKGGTTEELARLAIGSLFIVTALLIAKRRS